MSARERNEALAAKRGLADDSESGVLYVYRHALAGFAAKLSGKQVARLQTDARVAFVEEDRELVLHSPGVQNAAPWHLDRIDARDGYDQQYAYDTDGSGVTIYVVDNGVDYANSEFGGRATPGFDFTSGDGAPDAVGLTAQHGTAVASLAAGAQLGAAKGALVRSVKVYSSTSATASSMVAGLDWIRANHVKPSVAVASLGYTTAIGYTVWQMSAIDIAAANLINAGVPLVASAGNDSGNACNVSPGRVRAAITVGAMLESGVRWPQSNTGSCVDLFAPGGANVSAAGYGAGGFGGTSASAPIVAGIAARFLGRPGNALASPAVVENHVRSNASPLRVSGTFPFVTAPNLAFAEPVDPVMSVLYDARVQNWGQLSRVYDSMIAGTVAQNLSILSFRVSPSGPLANAGSLVWYRARFNGAWQAETSNGGIAGTTGSSGTISAITMRLDPNPLGVSICYQVHQAIAGWGPMVCDGNVAGNEINAVQAIRIYVAGSSTVGFRAPVAP